MTRSAIQIISPQQALQSLRDDLQLPDTTPSGDTIAVLACVLRRAAGFMCPCPPSTVINAVRRAMVKLPEISVALDEPDAVFDALLLSGDLVDVSRVSTKDSADQRAWIFCGPPSFLIMTQRAYLFGIAPDDAPFLPAALQAQVRYDGATRYLESDDTEALSANLVALGLRRHTEGTWLSRISTDTPATHLSHLRNRLERDGVPGAIPGVEVLASNIGPPVPYPQRWCAPAVESGLLVARAPQEFGAALWYLAMFDHGCVVRSVLLPVSDSCGRACDQAWRAQLAIDAAAGHPARYTLHPEGDGVRLHVSFPMPLDARRRLVYLGGLNNADALGAGPLFLPHAAVPAAEFFLRSALWLERADQLYT